MKNLKWIKEHNKHLLKSDEHTFLHLSINPTSGSFFNIGNKYYKISRKGFWKTVYIVTCSEEQILILSDSFWGNNGKISFNDGTFYTIKFTTRGGLKMWLMDGGNEIVSFTGTLENKNNMIGFSTGSAKIDATKLLILSALGMALFISNYTETSTGSDDSLLIMLAAGA